MAAGTLQSNDQVEVVESNGIIQILPRQTDMVYLPRYDAGAVYFSGAAGVSIAWGMGLPAGDWLSFYPAWDRHALYTGDWYAYSRSHGGWHARGGAGFGAMIGASGTRDAKEWRVAGNAQIRSSKYRQAQSRRNYARPQAMSASAGTVSGSLQNRKQQAAANSRAGSQHPATFSGDDYRQNEEPGRPADSRETDQNAQTNRSANEQRSNADQTQQLYDRNRAVQPNNSAEQNQRESEQHAQAQENSQNQRGQVNQNQEQRSTSEQERAGNRENPASENHPGTATSVHPSANHTEANSSAHPQPETKQDKKSPDHENGDQNHAPSSESSR
jgi:hypothetical protein